MAHSKNIYPLARNIGYAILIPMMFAAGPIVGYWFGSWVDDKWQTDPWGKVALSSLGFVGSAKQVLQLIKRISKT